MSQNDAMSQNQLEILAQKRDAILLAEIGAWLHMLYKYDWKFIEAQHRTDKEHDHEEFCDILFDDLKSWQHLSSLFDTLAPEIRDSLLKLSPAIKIPDVFNFKYFVKDHLNSRDAQKLSGVDRATERGDQLTILMIEAHGRGSGIEKGILYSKLEKQSLQIMPASSLSYLYMNTAFGFNKNLTSAHYHHTELRKALDKFIEQKIIAEFPNQNLILSKDRISEFKQILKAYFPDVVAETRRPANDITLTDQTTAAVAFFKAALAERVVARTWKDLKDGKGKSQYFWRVLTIKTDTFDYFSKALKLPDLLARKKSIEDAHERIHELIEVEYPFGSEIYRDQSVIAFLVPGEGNILGWTDEHAESLEMRIQKIYQDETAGDIVIQLQNALIDDPSRSVYTFGNMLSTTPPANLPDIASVETSWQGKPHVQICTNCRLRPQGSSEKARNRNICDTCLNKREARAKTWCTSQLETTVWLDEVADHNGRLALLACQFDLKDWLNGILWNSVRSILSQPYSKVVGDALESLNKKQFLGLFVDSDFFTIPKKVRNVEYNGQFEKFFKDVIYSDWKDIVQGKLDNQMKADISATHLLRQQPSFPRIRRAWNTTQQFFQVIQQEIEQGNLIPHIPNRLILRGNLSSANIGKYHAYDTSIKGIETTFVWDHEKKRFISADNLCYLAKQLGYKTAKEASQEEEAQKVSAYLSDIIEKESETSGLKFYENKTPSEPEDEERSFWLQDVSIETERHEYTPTVPILTEPQLFMVLTPADQLMNVALRIQEEYENQFSKVRNRLPLHVSLVYFNRRVPLYAAMNAAQRMLKRKSEEQHTWIVTDLHTDSKPNTANLRLKRKDQDVVTPMMEVNYNFGNDRDYHYPYFFTEQIEPEERPPHAFKAPLPHDPNTFKTLVHVSELKNGDEVYYTPSTFDYEFLDTTGRRFEIQYDEKGRRISKDKPARPYFLEQIAEFERLWCLLAHGKGLTTTQIKALDALIEGRREQWQATPQDETFRKFVADALHNINPGWWKRLDKEQQKFLQEAAQSSMLADVLEVYMDIMKVKPEREE